MTQEKGTSRKYIRSSRRPRLQDQVRCLINNRTCTREGVQEILGVSANSLGAIFLRLRRAGFYVTTVDGSKDGVLCFVSREEWEERKKGG